MEVYAQSEFLGIYFQSVVHARAPTKSIGSVKLAQSIPMHDFMSVTSFILVIGTIKVKKRYAITNNTPLSASGYRQPSEEEERNQSVGLS